MLFLGGRIWEVTYLKRMTAALQIIESKNLPLPETCVRSQNPDLFFQRYENCVHIFQLGCHGDKDVLPEASGAFLDLVTNLDECVAYELKGLTPEFRNYYFLEYFEFLGPELDDAREAWVRGLRNSLEEEHGTGHSSRRSSLSVQDSEVSSSGWSGGTLQDPASMPGDVPSGNLTVSWSNPSRGPPSGLEAVIQPNQNESCKSASILGGCLPSWCLGRHRNSST